MNANEDRIEMEGASSSAWDAHEMCADVEYSHYAMSLGLMLLGGRDAREVARLLGYEPVLDLVSASASVSAIADAGRCCVSEIHSLAH